VKKRKEFLSYVPPYPRGIGMQKDAEHKENMLVHGSEKARVLFFNLLQWALAGTSPPDLFTSCKVSGFSSVLVQ
jgi:hypothetical protein